MSASWRWCVETSGPGVQVLANPVRLRRVHGSGGGNASVSVECGDRSVHGARSATRAGRRTRRLAPIPFTAAIVQRFGLRTMHDGRVRVLPRRSMHGRRVRPVLRQLFHRCRRRVTSRLRVRVAADRLVLARLCADRRHREQAGGKRDHHPGTEPSGDCPRPAPVSRRKRRGATTAAHPPHFHQTASSTSPNSTHTPNTYTLATGESSFPTAKGSNPDSPQSMSGIAPTHLGLGFRPAGPAPYGAPIPFSSVSSPAR